jgi:hypothetical protein
MSYALSQVKPALTASAPTQKQLDMATRIVLKIGPYDREAIPVMSELSVRWGNLDMWKKTMVGAKYNLTLIATKKLMDAQVRFGFENIQDMYECLYLLLIRHIDSHQTVGFSAD